MIYLDNAATTMHKPQEVIDAVVNAMGSLEMQGEVPIQASLGAARIIYEARERLAKLFGAEDPNRSRLHPILPKAEYGNPGIDRSWRSCNYDCVGA